jgi:alginate O-acetyltransferase complex protein AlgI
MVFASHAFLVFLLIVLAVYSLATRRNERAGQPLLIAASLVFYGYWIPAYLLILIASILVNHVLARCIMHKVERRGLLVALGIALNLALIGYYKYAGFLVESLSWVLRSRLPVPDIVLPIGISFFTFQQISLLVDAYKGHVRRLPFWDHVFFISFFPQLIAGPIVRQNDLFPQLRSKTSWRLRADHVAVGVALFSVGLFKKAFLIDPVVPKIDLLFLAADYGSAMGFVDAWTAAIGYGFQIYFDFSAYSDMAIGLGFIFGIRLPINFFSPYKASSARAFWRRWHITLSRFLRDYLFIPLGGSRMGLARTASALLVTMSLGGLWHGASWTFVAWGLLHGLYLSINHAWRALVASRLAGTRERIRAAPILSLALRGVSVAITFLAVTFAWAFFRSRDFDSAFRLAKGMLGLTGWMERGDTTTDVAYIVPLYILICWGLPNTMQIFARSHAALRIREYTGDAAGLGGTARLSFARLSFAPSRAWAVTTAVVFVAAWFALANLNPFIYFQF